MEISRRSLIVGAAGIIPLLTYSPAYALYPFCRKLRLGNFGPPEMEDWGTELQNSVRKRIQWKDGLSIDPGRTYGKTREALNLVSGNAIDLATLYGGIDVKRWPDLAVLDDPRTQQIFTRNPKRAATLLDLIGEAPAKQGIILLGATHSRREILLASNKKIKSIKDFRGLKIRVADQRERILAEALGASAASMAFSEVYDALRVGAVDATVISLIAARRLRFRAETIVVFDAAQLMPRGYIMAMNRKVLDSGDERARQAFFEAGQESSAKYTAIENSKNNSSLEILQKEGTQLVSLPSDQFARAREIVLKRTEDLYRNIGVSQRVLEIIQG